MSRIVNLFEINNGSRLVRRGTAGIAATRTTGLRALTNLSHVRPMEKLHTTSRTLHVTTPTQITYGDRVNVATPRPLKDA
jgi:hypothetical protein